MNTSIKTNTLEKILTEQAVETGFNITIYNDDVNTFDWVILSLIEVCNHNEAQAEQCAMFIHFKGKYAVKHGSKNVLQPMKDALCDRGIHAVIEHN